MRIAQSMRFGGAVRGCARSSRLPLTQALAAALLPCMLAACTGTAPQHATGDAATTRLAAPIQIAFMPDVHFHDVYAEFQDGSFAGVTNPRNGRKATIRTMQAQLTSTRLFNENQFAFLAALDDAVARGVRIIALPGDFSDDGQPVHLRGLARILDDYTARYGVAFYAVPGNHDPVRPFDTPGGKPDFLGRDPHSGRLGPQGVYSRGAHPDCGSAESTQPMSRTHCSEDLRQLGYAGITEALAQHGFMPRPRDLYYATPYSRDSDARYDFATALDEAQWSKRTYTACAEGAALTPEAAAASSQCARVPDASYVVEPVEGLWLVALDANVYVPTGADAFTGSGDQGYNRMLTHKPQVIEWLREVVARGEAQGKRVIAFSHFPMAEFFNGASDGIAELLGAEAMQLVRKPSDNTTRALAATGLRVHVGGHMHLNDISVHVDAHGTLFNIQAPSLAAYVPAYTLMTLGGSEHIEVRTVRVDHVPRFDEFFELYRAEHADTDAAWDRGVLGASDYRDFTRRALAELLRLRLLDDDWPCAMRELVRSPLSGADLLVLSQLPESVTLGQLGGGGPHAALSPAFFECIAPTASASASAAVSGTELAAAERQARAIAASHGLTLDAFAEWRALDLAVDFVRLANAGDLAFDDVGSSRLAQYALLAEVLGTDRQPAPPSDVIDATMPITTLLRTRFGPLLDLLQRLASGHPTTHVRLDLARGRVVDLHGSSEPDLAGRTSARQREADAIDASTPR